MSDVKWERVSCMNCFDPLGLVLVSSIDSIQQIRCNKMECLPEEQYKELICPGSGQDPKKPYNLAISVFGSQKIETGRQTCNECGREYSVNRQLKIRTHYQQGKGPFHRKADK